MRLISFLFLLLAAVASVSAQVTDTLQTGDLEVIARDFQPAAGQPRVYEPKKALMWAIVPGGGQIYNRRWWKAPLVYGAFAGMIGVADFNQTNYQRFQRALRAECYGVTDTSCVVMEHEFTGVLSTQSLRRLRDEYDRNRQMSFIGVVIVYALQGVEAFVDSHLRTFDIDDDLGVRVRPALMPPGAYPVGLAIEIPLGAGPRLGRPPVD